MNLGRFILSIFCSRGTVYDYTFQNVATEVTTRMTITTTITTLDKLRGGTTRAEDAQGTPTQSHLSPSILIGEDKPLHEKRSAASLLLSPHFFASSLSLSSMELSDTQV